MIITLIRMTKHHLIISSRSQHHFENVFVCVLVPLQLQRRHCHCTDAHNYSFSMCFPTGFRFACFDRNSPAIKWIDSSAVQHTMIKSKVGIEINDFDEMEWNEQRTHTHSLKIELTRVNAVHSVDRYKAINGLWCGRVHLLKLAEAYRNRTATTTTPTTHCHSLS